MQGKIIKGIAGFYYVYAEDGILYACRAKGIFRKDDRKPLVGDNVEIVILDEKDREGSLVQILPRKNELIRPTVANVDQALIIFAVEDPKPNYLLLDRFLLMMEKEGIPALICINKTDLAGEDEAERIRGIYEGCGYPILMTSVEAGIGLEAVREVLAGKTTVVAGPSGVGKSSLTNALQGEIRMETGEISRKLKRGRHTTRHSQVIPLGDHTFLVDTPGFTSLYLQDMEEEPGSYYPEFRPLADKCRFQGCRHIHEPDCAVKDALRDGLISRQRYDNYLSLFQEFSEQKKYR